ncbi:MAG TPA: alpha-2-macroglobulin family protein [Gemmataceae bacterium]|nr:alpha-2-macroglobulin family protein [Gemmataceae bacterium]
MATCEQYQTQLLAHLYDLLEPNESQELKAHLDQCPACQAALAHARSQQQLLATAAKAEFTAVQFQPPVEIVTARPQTPVFHARSFRGSWPALAIAASILVLIGVGAPGAWWTNTYLKDKQAVQAKESEYNLQLAEVDQQVKHHNETIARATMEAEGLVQQVQRLQQEAAAKWTDWNNRASTQSFDVLLTGPAALQPGARNEYQIHTYAHGRPAPAKIAARVLDENKKAVFEQSVDMNGTFALALPADLPAKPDSKLSLEVVAEQSDGQKQEIHEALSLVAPVYLTHLTTDKPMYRPGETVHFRSLTLERFSLKPADENLHVIYTVTDGKGAEVFRLEGSPQLHDGNNQVILGPDKKPVHGVGAGDYQIDPGASGGEYTLTVSEASNRFPPQQRKFIVNVYRNPLLNKELDFTRKSYGPGAEVVAACKVSRVENKDVPVTNRPVTASIQIDGKQYGADGKEGSKPFQGQTDATGAVNVRFKLPAVMDRGLGTVSVQFTDGANIESLVKPIPIVLKKLDVTFFPEGGDLIAGAANRVYFQVRSMLGKPAELQGRIVDQDGKVVVDKIETLHDDEKPGVNQGMGLFTFTPEPGKSYELKIDAPIGMEGKYALSPSRHDGVVLSIPTGVSSPKQPINVTVQSVDKDRDLLIGAYCRGRLMDHQTVHATKGETKQVELKPAQGAGGVYRVTVFEEAAGQGKRKQLTPRAERLVYCAPAEQLILNVKPDKKLYVPGEKVTLNFSSINEKEQPAPAIVMVSVVDKSVIKMADEKTYRTMPTHYYLTTEVQKPEDLEYADFLLSAHPKATAALDLLLGTQGWRRFAEQDPGLFRQKNGAEAERLLATTGQGTLRSVDLLQHEAERLQTHYTTTMRELQDRQNKAMTALAAVRDDRKFPQDLAAVSQRAAQIHKEHDLAADRLEAHVALITRARSVLLPMAAVALIAATVILLVAALRRSNSLRALPLFASAALGVALIVAMVLYLPGDGMSVSRQLAMNQLAERPAAGNSNPTGAPGHGQNDGLAKAAEGPLDRFGRGVGAPAPMAADAPAPEGGLGMRGLPRMNEMAPPIPRNLPEVEKLADMQEERLGAFRNPAPAPAKGRAMMAAKPQFMKREVNERREADKEIAARRLMPLQEQAKQKDVAQKMEDRLEMGLQLDQRVEGLERKRMAGARALGGRGWGAGFGGFGGEPMQRGLGGPMAGPQAFFLQIQPPAAPPLLAREFAYHRSPSSPGEGRNLFADTVYWHPVLVLPDGKGQASFNLSDNVTGYETTVFGHTLDGRIGAVTTLLEARTPLTLEPKLPLEVTASDTIDVPVSIANNTPDQRPISMHVSATGMNIPGQPDAQLMLVADGRSRRLFRMRPTLVEGEANVTIEGKSLPFEDKVTRTLRVVPDGFPIVNAHSDVLEHIAQQDVVLPETWIKGTLKCQLQVFPSTLADLQKGLEALLREPGGCFEQTSSSNYPNVLILNYLKESDQTQPELEKHARDLLANGYQRLVAFECEDPSQPKRRGYEWFGGKAAPHEALTAYGLLEFRDMAHVYDVDMKMVERTRQYLMSRKDGKGGFQRNAAAIDTFGRAPDNITNAYIVWALTESGKDDDIEKELTALAGQARDSKDPYFIALVANSLINRNQLDDGVALLKKVAGAQKEDGHLDAAQTSITGSGGRDLQIETTALAVLGWLKANRPGDFNAPVQKAVKWLGQQRGGYGGFGSTQSTILALKALIAFTRANKKTPEAGELKLFVADQLVAQKAFPAGVQDALVLDVSDVEKHLKPGKNAVRVEITGKNVFPYTLTSTYRTLKPASADNLPVRLSTQLDRTAASEGESVHLTVRVENAEDKGQGMAVAIIGLPAGLTLPEDMKQLKDYALLRNNGKEKGLIGAWELRGRELVLYWRDLAPRQKIEVPLDLICRVPGDYRGPASRAYLYYNADFKHWVDSLKISIAAKAE